MAEKKVIDLPRKANRIAEFYKAHQSLAVSEYKIEEIFWESGNEDIGNLVGEIAELRSKYRKIFLSKIQNS